VKKKDSKKRFQTNERELDWRGFLVDADAVASLPFFARAIEATAHDDPDIVREAWDHRRSIVTSNGRDFNRYIQKFQNPPNNSNCRDLWGLLVIPNAQLSREKGLQSIRHGLDVPQHGLLRWPAAGFMNLHVRLTADGKTEIRRFKRCPFCEDPENDVKSSRGFTRMMKINPASTRCIPLAVVTFIVVGSCVTSAQDEQLFNYGKQWKSWPEISRLTYLMGFVNGQDSAYWALRGDVPPERREPLRLKTYTFYDDDALRDVMTNLYAEPANTYIRYSSMVYIARDKLAGNDIEPVLRRARENDTGFVKH
jgi:hypothetical protein